MANSITIYALIIGLISSFTQIARGQQSGSAKPLPSASSVGGVAESDATTANNPLAPMNALYFVKIITRPRSTVYQALAIILPSA